MDGEAESIAREAIEMALEGDTTAMRLVLERVLAPRKDRPVRFVMPKMETAGDAVTAAAALVTAVSNGDIAPTEAAELSKVVGEFIRAVETHEIQQRLDRLEALHGGSR